MKLKFVQCIYVASLESVINPNQEVELDNLEQAQSLIDAGYAVEVKTEEKPKRQAKSKKVGDE